MIKIIKVISYRHVNKLRNCYCKNCTMQLNLFNFFLAKDIVNKIFRPEVLNFKLLSIINVYVHYQHIYFIKLIIKTK